MNMSLIHLHLEQAKKSISSNSSKCYVFGNEAADLDSMATSLVYSAYKHALNPQQVFIPVIPISRADFPLRTEALWLFSQAGLTADDLIFLEDVNLYDELKNDTNTMIMIDHNRPAKQFSDSKARVVEVIDHHEDEGIYPDAFQSIASVGSCATLAAEIIFHDHREIIDTCSALLLAGTILLDTVNLDPEAGRVTPRDVAAFDLLKPFVARSQQEFFDALQFEKFNVSALSSYDILRKDYKEFAWSGITCGISSSLLAVSTWKQKDPELCETLTRYSSENSLDILIVMCAYTDPDFTREMIIFSKDSSLRKQVLDCLNEAGTGLSPMPKEGFNDAEGTFELYSQADIGKSRKKISPILQGCFS